MRKLNDQEYASYWREVHGRGGNDLALVCFPDKPPYYNRFFDRIQRYALGRYLRGEPGSVASARVLDVGCGRGRWLRFFREEFGVEGIGVDFSRDAVLACVRGGHRAVAGSVGGLPFRNGAFSLLTSITVLLHLPMSIEGAGGRGDFQGAVPRRAGGTSRGYVGRPRPARLRGTAGGVETSLFRQRNAPGPRFGPLFQLHPAKSSRQFPAAGPRRHIPGLPAGVRVDAPFGRPILHEGPPAPDGVREMKRVDGSRLPIPGEHKTRMQAHWGTAPCGSNTADERLRGREYFDEIERHRYLTHPWILEAISGFAIAGKDVLEIGFGMGTDHLAMARRGGNMHGIDFTPRNLEVTRERFALYGQTSELRNGDAENLPYPDGSFDFVYSFGVIHHSPDTARIVSEIRRVLRPGGRCFVAVYNRNSVFFYWAVFGVPIPPARRVAVPDAEAADLPDRIPEHQRGPGRTALPATRVRRDVPGFPRRLVPRRALDPDGRPVPFGLLQGSVPAGSVPRSCRPALRLVHCGGGDEVTGKSPGSTSPRGPRRSRR